MPPAPPPACSPNAGPPAVIPPPRRQPASENPGSAAAAPPKPRLSSVSLLSLSPFSPTSPSLPLSLLSRQQHTQSLALAHPLLHKQARGATSLPGTPGTTSCAASLATPSPYAPRPRTATKIDALTCSTIIRTIFAKRQAQASWSIPAGFKDGAHHLSLDLFSQLTFDKNR